MCLVGAIFSNTDLTFPGMVSVKSGLGVLFLVTCTLLALCIPGVENMFLFQ